MLGEPEGLPEMFPRAQPCRPVDIGNMIHCLLLLYVEVHILRTFVKGMQISVNYRILPTHCGNIDESFVLSSKGTLVCNTLSNILVLNRTSPSLLHTFVAYSTQLSIAIQHTGNSFLHQHIPCKRLRASSCSKELSFLTLLGISHLV